MAIKRGSTDIIKAYRGSTELTEIYRRDTPLLGGGVDPGGNGIKFTGLNSGYGVLPWLWSSTIEFTLEIDFIPETSQNGWQGYLFGEYSNVGGSGQGLAMSMNEGSLGVLWDSSAGQAYGAANANVLNTYKVVNGGGQCLHTLNGQDVPTTVVSPTFDPSPQGFIIGTSRWAGSPNMYGFNGRVTRVAAIYEGVNYSWTMDSGNLDYEYDDNSPGDTSKAITWVNITDDNWN